MVPAPKPGAEAPSESLAVTSLILGIVSIACVAFAGIVSLPLGVAAIVTARRSMRNIAASADAVGGRSLATAGFICGLVGTFLGTLVLAAGAWLLLTWHEG